MEHAQAKIVAEPVSSSELSADEAALVKDLFDTVRAHVFRRRIRTKDLFIDYDTLHSGRCTKEQFKRVMALILAPTYVHQRFASALDALAKLFFVDEPDAHEPKVVDYQKFCDAVDAVFLLDSLETGTTIDVPEQSVQEVLHRIGVLMKTRGFNFATCLQDTAGSGYPGQKGRIDAERFLRGFPLARDFLTQKAEFSKEQLRPVVNLYTDKCGNFEFDEMRKDIEILMLRDDPPRDERPRSVVTGRPLSARPGQPNTRGFPLQAAPRRRPQSAGPTFKMAPSAEASSGPSARLDTHAPMSGTPVSMETASAGTSQCAPGLSPQNAGMPQGYLGPVGVEVGVSTHVPARTQRPQSARPYKVPSLATAVASPAGTGTADHADHSGQIRREQALHEPTATAIKLASPAPWQFAAASTRNSTTPKITQRPQSASATMTMGGFMTGKLPARSASPFCQDVVKKLLRLTVERRLHIHDAFRDADKLRSGMCTESAMRAGLALLAIQLSAVELETLFEHYKTEDGLFRYQELCCSIEESIRTSIRVGDDADGALTARALAFYDAGALMTKPVNVAGSQDNMEKKCKEVDEESKRLDSNRAAYINNLHASVATQVRQRGLDIGGMFKDFAKSCSAKARHVTTNHFFKVMKALNIRMTREDLVRLCQAHVDLEQKNEFNYVDFCSRVDPSFLRCRTFQKAGRPSCGLQIQGTPVPVMPAFLPPQTTFSAESPYFDKQGRVRPCTAPSGPRPAKARPCGFDLKGSSPSISMRLLGMSG